MTVGACMAGGMCGRGACMAGGVNGRGCAWQRDGHALQRMVRILLMLSCLFK